MFLVGQTQIDILRLSYSINYKFLFEIQKIRFCSLSIHFMVKMPHRMLLILLILCICFAIINSKSQCSCSCCKGNRCIQRYQGSFSLPTCSARTCKHACKIRYPGQCVGSPGTLLATCTKTKKVHRTPLKKKLKPILKPNSKKHLYHRP